MSWQQRYVDRFYRTRANWQNGSQQFHHLIETHIAENAVVLELGAGPSNHTTKHLSERSSCVDGLDIDQQVKDNEFLDQRIVYNGEEFPLEDARYDAVVADYVLEHIEYPQRVLAEISRVLKPGGVFLFRTPNLFHYVGMVSFLTPHLVHRLGAKFVHGTPAAPEPYPTFYRLNTARRIRRLCQHAGLQPTELEMVEKEPSYLMFSRPAFLAGVAYERLVNSTRWLSLLRVNIFGVCQRQPTDAATRTDEPALQTPSAKTAA